MALKMAAPVCMLALLGVSLLCTTLVAGRSLQQVADVLPVPSGDGRKLSQFGGVVNGPPVPPGAPRLPDFPPFPTLPPLPPGSPFYGFPPFKLPPFYGPLPFPGAYGPPGYGPLPLPGANGPPGFPYGGNPFFQ